MTDRVSNPNTMSHWVGKDVSEVLKPFYSYVNGFHSMALKNCYLYMNVGLEIVPSFMVKNERITLPTVEVYDLKAGTKQGVRFGFVFRSPLPCIVHTNYLIFHRKQLEAKEIVVRKQEAKRKYAINNLLFFTIDDDAVLISNMEKNGFIDSLES